jgi:hypothetical protein
VEAIMKPNSAKAIIRFSIPGIFWFLSVALVALPGADAAAQMTLGANLWRIDWGGYNGGQPEYAYFANGVNWATTTNPWNPAFIAELQQAGITCLRFMDWAPTNGNQVTTWSQRISKTANHYNSGNSQPLDGGTGYGVAYEWMIDLCNRINADMWVCVPHRADTNYARELATLVRDNLSASHKVYVEFSNECWNDGFSQTGWLDNQTNIVGLPNPLRYGGRNIYGFGNGGDCRWSEYVWFACRTMDQFNKVFGTNSPRLVKVLAGQVSWDGASNYNSMCGYHLACLQTTSCNPWGVKIDAYAQAPYYSGANESAMRASITEGAKWLRNTKTALTGSGIPLICYEGGPDNYSSQSVANSSFQYQLIQDALDTFALYVEGVYEWYTFAGGCWGLKVEVGDDAAASPKWRGWLDWVGTHVSVLPPATRSVPARGAWAVESARSMRLCINGRRVGDGSAPLAAQLWVGPDGGLTPFLSPWNRRCHP